MGGIKKYGKWESFVEHTALYIGIVVGLILCLLAFEQFMNNFR